jgi:hypothetical protein
MENLRVVSVKCNGDATELEEALEVMGYLNVNTEVFGSREQRKILSLQWEYTVVNDNLKMFVGAEEPRGWRVVEIGEYLHSIRGKRVGAEFGF